MDYRKFWCKGLAGDEAEPTSRRTSSRFVIGQQYWDVIYDGIAAITAIASDEIFLEHEGRPTDRTREQSEILLLECGSIGRVGHVLKV